MSAFTGHLPGSRGYRRLSVGLFFAGVATFAQLYMPQALLPAVADAFRVTPAQAALTVSAATIGVALSVVPWSLAADRVGRVPAMAVGIIAATVFGIAAPLSTLFGMLLTLRLLEGIALGAVPAIALAYLSEEVDAAHTATAAGGYISGTSVGGLSGRLIAGPFGEAELWRFGLLATALVCAGCAVLFLVLIPPARGYAPPGRRTMPSVHPRGAATGVRRRVAANLRDPRQVALYAQGFLLMGAFVAFYNYLGFRLTAPPYDLPIGLVSLLFVAYLAGTVTSGRAGALASRRGRLPVLVAAILVMTAGAAVTLAGSLVVVIGGLLVFTGGFFAAQAVASGWAPATAADGARAQSSALYYLAYYAGSSLFGWLLGIVFAGVGWGGVVAATLVLCALALSATLLVLRSHS